MTAKRRPAGDRANVIAALQRRVAALEAANRELAAGLDGRDHAEAEPARLAAIVEAMPDMVYTADLQGNIVYVNRAGRAVFAAALTAGLTVSAVHPAWAVGLLLRDGIPAATRDGVWRGETAVLGCDGRELPVSQVVLMHRGAGGQARYTSSILRDLSALRQAEQQHRSNGYRFEAAVTDRQRAEAELARSLARLQALASELTLAEARERRRLAASLHDEVGQGLALSRIKLGLLGQSLTTAGARAVFTELRELFTEMSQRIRTLTFELSPPVLYQLGLAAAVEWLAEKLEKEHGLRCRVECHSSLERVDETVSILLFQSVRELLVNIGKHAHATQVAITICFAGGWVTLTVKDDGVGFDPQTASTLSHKQDSFGLFSVGERLRYVNGTIAIDSAPGRGTSVTLSAPMTGVR